ncbi:DUF2949 domain-containing protein [Baaleninema sp.]|uniref:DUF2949 domain-containing protein n=1 Tax=Baaleninema sp. TaxID=3101197 RepID=UPI003D08DB06
MKFNKLAKLIRFLQDDLSIPATSIDLALRRGENSPNTFSMVLWQYGLITIDQLDRIFDWLETA